MDHADDPDVADFFGPGTRANQNVLNNFLQPAESPVAPGDYYGIDAPEFGTHAAGQVVRITGQPTLNPDQMTVAYVTHRDTSGTTDTPKGVPLTHRNLMVNLDGLLSEDLVDDDDRVLMPLPLHHVYPYMVGMVLPLALGVADRVLAYLWRKEIAMAGVRVALGDVRRERRLEP